MTDRARVLRQVFTAVTEGRAREIAGLIEPEMAFVSVVAGKVFVGPAGLEDWWRDVNAYYELTEWEILEYRQVGEHDVIRWRFVGRARASGIEFDTEMSQLWSYRDGLVSRVEVFPDAGGALRAAGG